MIAQRLASLLGSAVERAEDLAASHAWTLHRVTQHPLLVHVVLFGAGYRSAALAAAHAALRA